MHPVVHDSEHIKGVRTVATVEFVKGLIVVAAGLGVFSMRHHKDLWGIAESFLEFFHANPYHHYVGVFIALVSRFNDVRLWKIAVAASIYAAMRFVEAYGLWYALPWAEWMAFISGAVYIPFEMIDLIRRPTPIRLAIIVINALVVLYMLHLRVQAAERRRRAAHKHAEST
ncbi:MAG: DUF2127 domain-containing protein [Terriglobales bacterium]|jgi:uncharacterized membrane protein (DUF2068 family)